MKRVALIAARATWCGVVLLLVLAGEADHPATWLLGAMASVAGLLARRRPRP